MLKSMFVTSSLLTLHYIIIGKLCLYSVDGDIANILESGYW